MVNRERQAKRIVNGGAGGRNASKERFCVYLYSVFMDFYVLE